MLPVSNLKEQNPKGVLVLVPQWSQWSADEQDRYLKQRWHPELEREQENKKKVERVVVGYARVKENKMFARQDREYEVLSAGTVLEVLKPDQRDEQDLERQARMDHRQLVVLRWKKRAILLFGSDVERAERSDWERDGNPKQSRKSDR